MLASSEDISRAIGGAVGASVGALSKSPSLGWHNAYVLSSLVVSIGVSQLVDPRKTAWARIPKHIAPPSRVLKVFTELRGRL
ncbi:hypothetical protein [Thermogladius sp.]|uniref:hypothetical protein n=1 Tax=Thermogladius sp. TaxID=2023064 RepID=UPI003D0ACAE6